MMRKILVLSSASLAAFALSVSMAMADPLPPTGSGLNQLDTAGGECSAPATTGLFSVIAWTRGALPFSNFKTFPGEAPENAAPRQIAQIDVINDCGGEYLSLDFGTADGQTISGAAGPGTYSITEGDLARLGLADLRPISFGVGCCSTSPDSGFLLGP